MGPILGILLTIIFTIFYSLFIGTPGNSSGAPCRPSFPETLGSSDNFSIKHIIAETYGLDSQGDAAVSSKGRQASVGYPSIWAQNASVGTDKRR